MASSKRLGISFLVLRLLTLLLLAASIVVLATDRVAFSDGTKNTFKDAIAYRHVIATTGIGFLYTLFQMPFAIYHAFTGERMVQKKCNQELDCDGDKVIALLMATGVGAGFAVTFELKKLFPEFLDILAKFAVLGIDELRSKTDKFFDRANIAVGLLSLAFLCSIILSILSSINRTTSSSSSISGFFFG